MLNAGQIMVIKGLKLEGVGGEVECVLVNCFVDEIEFSGLRTRVWIEFDSCY